MDRRVFIVNFVLGSLAMPRTALTQAARNVHRIGILSSRSTTSEMVGAHPQDPLVNALLRGLRELGYVYGEHFMTEPRGGEGEPERFPGLAVELVRLQVDVIVASGPMLPALKQATSTIPVVTTGAGDPLASGYVQSLARPGGNITGLTLQIRETDGKRLELLKELVPGAAPVAIIWDPRVSSSQAAESAARERGWRLLSLEIRDAGEIEKAFKTATGARAGALLVTPSGLPDAHARRIAELAPRSRLPTMSAFRFSVRAGRRVACGLEPCQHDRRGRRCR